MTLGRLVFEEMRHRWGSFVAAVLTIALLGAAVTAFRANLRLHDHQTERSVQTLHDETQAEMDALENSIRKSMKGLGFNIYIFPEGQDLSEVYAAGYASKTMPEAYVEKLAASKIVTVNHLLPRLTQKLTWPETKRTIFLVGVRGEVPIMHGNAKKPLVQPVAPGTLVLGHELAASLGLAVGDSTTLMGRTFSIAKIHPARGDVDDVTVWMDLAACQDLLGKPGQINAILALECNCETVDRIGEIRKELHAILPGTQIVEHESRALARAEARVKAAEVAAAQMAAVQAQRQQLRGDRASLALTTSIVLALLCMGVTGLLTLLNVRERTREIGVFRAIGLTGGKILAIFLLRGGLAGLAGAVLGLTAGALYGRVGLGVPVDLLLTPGEAVAVLAGLPLLACAGAWLPALHAATRQPAETLRHD